MEAGGCKLAGRGDPSDFGLTTNGCKWAACEDLTIAEQHWPQAIAANHDYSSSAITHHNNKHPYQY